MVTRSRRMFRQMTLTCTHDVASSTSEPEISGAHTVLVPGSTSNTLLLSKGAEPSSSIVPTGAYVQLWGYLEPTDDAISF
jgi:hypothetical protein